MSLPIMPKATAIWLIDNTTLSFEQIGEFCGLHPLEIQAIADGEIAANMVPFDPIINKIITAEEIERCSKDPNERLQAATPLLNIPSKKKKGGRYTPVAKRQDKPNAIAWFLKHYPEISDIVICRFLGTTRPTIKAIRERTHRDSTNIEAHNPVSLGLCSAKELDNLLAEEEKGKQSKTK